MKKYNENKIFVTGVSGSGKTTFATKYSDEFNIKYIDFDLNWNYAAPSDENYEKIIKEYSNEFIIDAIPFAQTNNRLKFLDYYEENNDIKIICICCTNKEEFDKRSKYNYIIQAYHEYNTFYFGAIKNIYSKLNIEYFDSYTNEFISEDELFKRINWINDENVKSLMTTNLMNYLNAHDYDKLYQDIDCINFIGYSESFKTWNNIKDLIDWNNKKVADLGCFHCYFAFKVAKLGANVTGLDISETVLKTSYYLNQIEKNIIKTKKWEGGEEVSEDYDIALCLNVLHHFSDIEKGLKNIKSKIAIFETNKNLIDMISVEFNIIKSVESHRDNRIILLCEKNEK